MKLFFKVLLVSSILILFSVGQIGLSIFASAFVIILWTASVYNGKSVEQIIEEANAEGTDTVYVEYHFVSESSEKFTAELHHYSNGSLSEADILPKLAEYISEHTGIPIEAERLHITKIQTL